MAVPIGVAHERRERVHNGHRLVRTDWVGLRALVAGRAARAEEHLAVRAVERHVVRRRTAGEYFGVMGRHLSKTRADSGTNVLRGPDLLNQ